MIASSQIQCKTYDGIFCKILENTKNHLNQQLQQTTKTPNAFEFEEWVLESMFIASKNTIFEGTIFRAGKHAFPDIIAKKMY